MIEFNFKSQVATTIEQSERLIALGLKKETADMFIGTNWGNELSYDNNGGYTGNLNTIIPAWSLHRLLSMLNEDDNIIIEITAKDGRYGIHSGYDTEWHDNLYDGIIAVFDELIKEGYFNKEYLNGTTED